MRMILEIDPTVDFACKRILGNPDHPAITIHFLNAVFRPASPIVEVLIVNPIVERRFEADKLSILDVLAIDSTGRRFNVEIQRTVPPWLPQRLTYYAATQLTEQIGEGDNYLGLRPSIGICLLNALLFPTETRFHHEFRLRSKHGLELTDCLEIHLLELPKYAIPDDNVIIVDALEQWICFFRIAKGLTRKELLRRLPDPIFAEAAGVLEMISRNPEERRLYNARLKMELDENTKIQAALAEGEIRGELKGEIKLIQTLQGLLRRKLSSAEELQPMSLEQLKALSASLQEKLRKRSS